MKKILIFTVSCMLCICGAGAATRDGNAAARAKSTTKPTQRVSTTVKSERAVRTSTLSPRAASNTTSNTSRAATARANPTTVPRATQNQTPISRVTARATSTSADLTQTRVGAEYETCKTAYFTCMDQFCGLKNDDYRRCSCSNRIYDLADQRAVLTQAGEQLSIFTENLDAVGLTAAQAAAMKTASQGEAALTADASASKALLQAIMNSIRGDDATVGGKYTDLNSINISFDTSNAFGTMDAGQAIAAYDGQNLYSAVYPQCRAAVRADCNDASLQRAITAYLMAIEQDCTTVQTAINNKQKELKAAIREGSAMLDLARVENRQKHNSSDFTACMNAVESAVLSEQVCGANYHKCLDNGKYIDISTGAPIAGVSDFYKLEKMLTFTSGKDAADQKLSKITSNREFVQSFEKKTKKFAADALDKCVEIADDVWAEYLDKAMLDIYYAQKAKVAEIRQGCFDFVSACYMDGDKSITDAMRELTGDSSLIVMPDKVALTTAMCNDYVHSCNNMFDDDIISQYIDYRKDTDTLTACRAIVKQCFDSFGGANYENFYYPYSGLFKPDAGNAPDWFTLYEVITEEAIPANVTNRDQWLTNNGYFTHDDYKNKYVRYKSTCAQQLAEVESCNDIKMIEEAFGGLDKAFVSSYQSDDDDTYEFHGAPEIDANGEQTTNYVEKYGLIDNNKLSNRTLRPTGVATEVYNQVIDNLSTQCVNLQGRFLEIQLPAMGKYNTDNKCILKMSAGSTYISAPNPYGFYKQTETPNRPGFTSQIRRIYLIENMCPRDYTLSVDINSWGVCSCWENGARRSKNGKTPKCVAALPVSTATNDTLCNSTHQLAEADTETGTPEEYWCTRDILSSDNQVCPLHTGDMQGEGADTTQEYIGTQKKCDEIISTDKSIPDGLSM